MLTATFLVVHGHVRTLVFGVVLWPSYFVWVMNGRKRVDGKFMGPGGTFPASQAICSSLLEECFDIVQEIRAQDESKNVASSLKPIYDRLTEIRRELESLVRLFHMES